MVSLSTAAALNVLRHPLGLKSRYADAVAVTPSIQVQIVKEPSAIAVAHDGAEEAVSFSDGL